MTEPNIALIGSPGSGKTTAAEYLVKRFGYHYSDKEPIVVDGLTNEDDYWLMREQGVVIVRVVADQDQRAARTNNSDIGDCPLAGLKADHLVFNQGTRDLMYDQLIEVIYQEVARF